MNKELSLRTLTYLVGYYKTHNETIINLEEIEAINFILDENEQLQQELDKKNKIIEEIKKYVKLEGVSYLDFAGNRCFCNKNQARYILEKIEELEKGERNE